MQAELYFLKYAYPCAFVLKDKGIISQEELDEIKKYVLSNKVMDKPKLEKLFHNAFNFSRHD